MNAILQPLGIKNPQQADMPLRLINQSVIDLCHSSWLSWQVWVGKDKQ